MADSTRVRIGVLALQGSFREHMALAKRVEGVADVIEVRTKEELASVSGLIIPGGESTTMAHIAESDTGFFIYISRFYPRFSMFFMCFLMDYKLPSFNEKIYLLGSPPCLIKS